MAGCAGKVIAAVILVFLATMATVTLLVVWAFLRGTQIDFENKCSAGYLQYPGPFETFTQGAFQQQNALLLMQLAVNVTLSNCPNLSAMPPLPTQCKLVTRFAAVDPVAKVTRVWGIGVMCASPKLAVVSFAGSWSLSTWILDFEVPQVTPDGLAHVPSDALVHSGFWEIYNSIQGQLVAFVDSVPSTTQLIMSGHSLGGALSTLAALDFADRKPFHYSFASPRVGNPSFAGAYSDHVRHGFRVANTEDVVPALPPPILDEATYEHVESPVVFTLTEPSYSDLHILSYLSFLATGSFLCTPPLRT